MTQTVRLQIVDPTWGNKLDFNKSKTVLSDTLPDDAMNNKNGQANQ